MESKTIIASPVGYKLLGSDIFFPAEDWMKSVLAQDYPNLSIYLLNNDLLPYMVESLESIADDRCVLENVILGNEPDVRGKRRSKDKDYSRFAKIRNMVLDYVLGTDATYYVSIDSDIMVHPDTVTRLVSLMEEKPEYCMIGGIVNNTRRIGMCRNYPGATYNFGVIHSKQRKGKSKVRALRKFKVGEFLDVAYTGACTIMRVDTLKQNPTIRWGAHTFGEDLYICERITEAGYKIGVDTSIVTLHKMDDTVWKQDVEAFNKREFV